jgi:probable rRNA maturation factor
MTDDGDRPHILFSDRQHLPVDQEDLAVVARETLLGEGRDRVELSVSFVTREEMASLHERYMGEPGPTDVLSFPLGEEPSPAGEPRLLGDVVICPSVAAERPDPVGETRLLLVHGILHLLGYDHETEEQRAEMWPRQERYAGVWA